MLGIVEKVKSVFCSDFVRKIIRQEKSTQEDEEAKKESNSKGQTRPRKEKVDIE